MRKGDIYLATLDPTQGVEIKKTRPVLIFQNNIATENGCMATVLPISSTPYKNRIFEVFIKKNSINHLFCDSKILVHQIRSIDKSRLIKKIGCVEDEILFEAERKLKIHLDIT